MTTADEIHLPTNWELSPDTSLLKWRDEAATADRWDIVDQLDEELNLRGEPCGW
jgi:hypothetical protein